MSKFGFLIKNSTWFFCSSVTGRVLSLALLPLYTAYLSPTDYGIVAVCIMVSDIVSSFSTLGLESFAGRIIVRFFEKKDRLAVLLGNVYLASITLMLVTSLILSLFPELIHSVFFDNSEIPSAIILLFPIWLSFFKKVTSYLKGYQQIMQKGRGFFVIATTRSGLLHILKIIALVALRYGVVGFLVAELITEGLIAVWSVILLHREVKPRVRLRKRRIVKMGIRYGLPSVPDDLSSWILRYIDRIILLKLIDMWNVGLYSFGMSLTSAAFNFVFYPIRSGVTPEIVRRMDHPDKYYNAHKNVIEYLYAIVLLTSQCGLIISLFAREGVYFLANERYHSAYVIVPLIVLYLIFQNAREIFAIPINLKYKTGFHPLNTLFGGFINICGNLLLIPIFGILGAAVITVLSNATIMLTTLVYAQRLMYINYNFLTASLPVVAATILFLSSTWIDFSSGTTIIVKILFVLISAIFSMVYMKRTCPTIWESLSNFVYRRERIGHTEVVEEGRSV
ncbi:MAG: polysaccharide biosynthesis protein [Deltaproteobacteria bacterium]|nr:polysaccharide biosynthesis protein [Deltaproteobacteria bacterium]